MLKPCKKCGCQPELHIDNSVTPKEYRYICPNCPNSSRQMTYLSNATEDWNNSNLTIGAWK